MILKSLLERVRDDVTRANDVSERKLIRIDFRTKVKTKRPLDHETKKTRAPQNCSAQLTAIKKSYQYPRSSAVDNGSNNLASGWRRVN